MSPKQCSTYPMVGSALTLNDTAIYLSGVTIKIKIMMPPVKKKALTKFAVVDVFEPVNVLYDRLKL